MHQGDPGWVKAYGDVAKRFEEANPDVDIELIYAPHDAYNEKFSAAVMSKQLPDVMELDAPFLANYVWSGYLQPIKPLIDQDVLDDMTEDWQITVGNPYDMDTCEIEGGGCTGGYKHLDERTRGAAYYNRYELPGDISIIFHGKLVQLNTVETVELKRG